jgi:hypothetical protein
MLNKINSMFAHQSCEPKRIVPLHYGTATWSITAYSPFTVTTTAAVALRRSHLLCEENVHACDAEPAQLLSVSLLFDAFCEATAANVFCEAASCEDGAGPASKDESRQLSGVLSWGQWNAWKVKCSPKPTL